MSNKDAREVMQYLNEALKPAYPNTTLMGDSNVKSRRNEYDLRKMFKIFNCFHWLFSIFYIYEAEIDILLSSIFQNTRKIRSEKDQMSMSEILQQHFGKRKSD